MNSARAKKWNVVVLLSTWLVVLLGLAGGIALAAGTSKLCAVTSYFNPLHYRSRLANFVEARAWSRRQGLRLVVVELAFGEDPFELEGHVLEDDPLTKVIRLRTGRQNVMWQKEALLNVGFAALGGNTTFGSCEHIAWLDSDVILEDGWIEAADDMLSREPIGQVFTHLVRLPQGVFSPFAYWSEARMQRMGIGNKEGQVQMAASMVVGGHTGFAWAARRELLMSNNVSGLYDRCIVGGFDAILSHALNDPRCETRMNEMMQEDFDRWVSRFFPKARIRRSGVPQKQVKAAALWHGEIKDRLYQERHEILLKHEFHPNKHVRLGENGVLEWTGNASCALKRDVLIMFSQRKEDGMTHELDEDVAHSYNLDKTCDAECALG